MEILKILVLTLLILSPAIAYENEDHIENHVVVAHKSNPEILIVVREHGDHSYWIITTKYKTNKLDEYNYPYSDSMAVVTIHSPVCNCFHNKSKPVCKSINPNKE